VTISLLLAAALGGCMAADRPAPWEGGVRPLAGGRASPEDLAALDEAVRATLEMKYEQAVPKFSRLAGRFESAGDVARAAEAKFWMGFCYEKLGRAEDARAFYGAVAERYAGTAAARQAASRLSRLREGGVPGR